MLSAPFEYELKTCRDAYKCMTYTYKRNGIMRVAYVFPIAYDLTYYGYTIHINEELPPNRFDVPRDRWISEEELNVFNEKYPKLPRLCDLFPDIDLRPDKNNRIRLTKGCYIQCITKYSNTRYDHYAGSCGMLLISGYAEKNNDVLDKFVDYFNHPTYEWLINSSRMRNNHIQYLINGTLYDVSIKNIDMFESFVEDYKTGTSLWFHDNYTDRAIDPIEPEPTPVIEQPKRVTWRWSV